MQTSLFYANLKTSMTADGAERGHFDFSGTATANTGMCGVTGVAPDCLTPGRLFLLPKCQVEVWSAAGKMENPKHGDAGWIIHRKFVPETSTQPGFCFSILLFSSVGTLQFPICSQTFTSVSSVEIEHSRSAWSTVFSQCRVCSSDCYNVKNEMDFAIPQKSHR